MVLISVIFSIGSGSLNNSENSSRRDSIAEEKERLAIADSMEMSTKTPTIAYITPPNVTTDGMYIPPAPGVLSDYRSAQFSLSNEHKGGMKKTLFFLGVPDLVATCIGCVARNQKVPGFLPLVRVSSVWIYTSGA